MFNKIKLTIIAQLTQGVSPHSLALSCALAFVLATFPIVGTTTIAIVFVAYYLKLNQPIMQALNYLLTPIYLIMLPVYLRAGEWLVGATPVSINPATILTQFSSDWRLMFSKYGMAGLYAVLAWALIAPFAGIILFYIFKPVFEGLQKRFSTEEVPTLD